MKLVYWVTVCLVFNTFAGFVGGINIAHADPWDKFYESRRQEVNKTSSMNTKEGMVSAKNRVAMEKDIQQKLKKRLSKGGKPGTSESPKSVTNSTSVKKRTYQQGPVSNQPTSIKVDAVPSEMVFPGRKTPSKK